MTGNSTTSRGMNARDKPSALARLETMSSLAASFGKVLENIHYVQSRINHSFIPVNCRTIIQFIQDKKRENFLTITTSKYISYNQPIHMIFLEGLLDGFCK